MATEHPIHERSEQAKLDMQRNAGLATLSASILFTGSLIIFRQLRLDGYTHGTKAVSELGAVGAPNAIAFNLLGFVLPGLLVVFAAATLARATGNAKGMALLALTGAAWALTGVFPFDMAARASLTSQAHLAAAMLTGLFWALALFRSPPTLVDAGQAALARHGRWLVLALLANIAWQVAQQSGAPILPGWGQRLGFAGMMLWLGLLGLGLLRAALGSLTRQT